MMPILRHWDWIVINSSAGKDSQAMTDLIVKLCMAEGIEPWRLVLLHCDLGKSPRGEDIEWPGTVTLAREHAAHYGLRFEIVKRTIRGFLEEIKKRGKWPSSTERYCTSYFKREQGAKLITRLANETRLKFRRQQPRILNCFGFRAEESPRRKKMDSFAINDKLTTSRKEVWDWLPIQDWTTAQVWERIAQAGTRHHYAYDLGMTRLSCRFCIFAPQSQLLISARENPALFQEYVELEREMGHTFRMNLPLADVEKLRDSGAVPESDDGCWNM